MSESVFLENKKLNQLEIEQKRTVLRSKVTSMVVTLTTKCNLSCIMCEEIKIPWDIPERTIKEIIALFPYLEQIIWQGGEVLILDYFQDFLDEARKHPHLYQSIITNGLAITNELLPMLVRDNMELTFSIDAATRQLYESIRRKASFDLLLQNIRLVNAARKRQQLTNMSFRMHVVVMNSNYHELEKFIDFAKELPKTVITVPLISQLVRAGTSVGSNYCEADCAETRKDFEHKLGISKKESKETRHWLRMITRAVPEKQEKSRVLWQEANELNLIFTSIVKKSRNHNLEI